MTSKIQQDAPAEYLVKRKEGVLRLGPQHQVAQVHLYMQQSTNTSSADSSSVWTLVTEEKEWQEENGLW